ncbi:MAG TPA: helix-turn-helix transcriptional regulator [Gemmatimonadaceae bacterium]|nr:helix-turn-helix transcriptional regulator [Gemmatimonadaceae bacterium]
MPSETWLAASGLTISEWHCPGAVRALGPEEAPAAYELSVVREGAYLRHLRDRTVAADPSTLLCGTPAEPFRLAQRVGAAARETVVALDEPSFRALLGETDPRAGDAAAATFPADAITLTGRGALVHAALLRVHREGSDPVALQELAMELARWAVRPDTRPRRPARALSRHAMEAVHHTRATLAMRFAERLTLDDLGRAVSFTSWHLSRVFRAATGESVHQHLLRIRLHAALERVALGGRNLSRIALECGFSSHSHFTSAFRRAYGSSPSRAFHRGPPASMADRPLRIGAAR